MTEEHDDAEDLIALFRDAPALGDDEPDPRIEALLAGSLSKEEAQALAQQAIDDPDLALAIRVAAAMDEARQDAATAEPPKVVRIDRAQRRSRVLAVVTIALAAAAAVFLIMRPRPPAEFDDDAVRTGVDKRIRPAEGTDRLPKDAFTLRWVGGPESATYDLFVTTSDLRVVYQALEQRATEHTVPAASLADLAPGTTLLWRVVAVTSDGRKIHSTAFEVVIE